MATVEEDRIIKQIRLGDRGVDLWHVPEEMDEGEAIMTGNCYYRRGLFQRTGYSKHSNDNVVNGGFPVVGLHRFYYNSASKVLLAACETTVKQMNDSTGAWTSVRTGQTSGLPTFFTTWGALNKCYVANGTDAPFSIDSAVSATTESQAPATTLMFCAYRDRLLSIETANPSYLRWSDSYDTSGWTDTSEAIRTPGAGTNVSITLHSISDNINGIDAMVFVAKTGSIGLFSGTNLDPASDGFNARFDVVGGAESVGCISPRTIISTPKGTIFLGNDRQVYILPFGTSRIVPIGHKIISQSQAILGIESIPLSQLSKACAVYHEGFYKLAFAVSGGTSNTYQYWLDVDRMEVDDRGHYGPWYGPMTGMVFSCFTKQDGASDDGRLLGGGGGQDGRVYRVNESTTYSDNGNSIVMDFKSRHEAFSGAHLNTRIMESDVTLKPSYTQTIQMGFNDITTPISTATAISPPDNTGVYWGSFYWGDEYWYGTGVPVRRKVEFYEKDMTGRFISTQIRYTSDLDSLQVYSVLHRMYPSEPVME